MPAEADHRPEVCLAAERRLAELLGAGDYDLIAEWLRCLAALDRARRAPDVLVPALLTGAVGRPGLRASLMPVLGPLAGWLAGFNEEWAWAGGSGGAQAAAGASDVWETSGIEDRRALLRKVRARDPAGGRGLGAPPPGCGFPPDRAVFRHTRRLGARPAPRPGRG